MSDATLIVAARDVMAADFSPDVVLLNLQDGVYYGLEDVGARVWTLLQSPMTIGAVCDAIVAEFDVDPARGAREVRAFIQQLIDHRLVMVRTDAR
jgi:hypothetical protein